MYLVGGRVEPPPPVRLADGRMLDHLRRRDRLALGARHDQHLADHEVRVLQVVGGDDVGLVDLVLGGDGVERVVRRHGQDQPAHRRDRQDLAQVQLVLGVEVVRPPQGHHRDVELVGDAGQRVARLDLVGAQEIRSVLDGGIHRDRLEERAVVEEGSGDPGQGHDGRAHLGPDVAEETRVASVDADGAGGIGGRTSSHCSEALVEWLVAFQAGAATDRDPGTCSVAGGPAHGSARGGAARRDADDRCAEHDAGDGKPDDAIRAEPRQQSNAPTSCGVLDGSGAVARGRQVRSGSQKIRTRGQMCSGRDRADRAAHLSCCSQAPGLEHRRWI